MITSGAKNTAILTIIVAKYSCTHSYTPAIEENMQCLRQSEIALTKTILLQRHTVVFACITPTDLNS